MIKNVIFDVDGTLVDSNRFHAEAWRRAFAEFGKEIELDQILAQIGKGGDQLMPEFLSEEEIAEFGEALEDYRNEVFEAEYLNKVEAFPDVRRLFERIREMGGRIVLASSSPEKQLAEFKRIADIEDLLEDATSADDARESKPEPDIFLAALKKLDDPPVSEVVVVGDTAYDAISAKKAGLAIIGVTCGGWSETNLRKAGCAEVYAGPADLLDRIDDSLITSGETD